MKNNNFAPHTEQASSNPEREQSRMDAVMQLGKRAIDAVGGHISQAVRETGVAGAGAAMQYTLDYLGLERRQDVKSGREKLHIADSRKLGHLALMAFADPKREAIRFAKGAYGEVRETVKNTSVQQAKRIARDTLFAA